MPFTIDEKDVRIAVLATKLERVQTCLSFGMEHLSSDTSARALVDAANYFRAALVESASPVDLTEGGLEIEIVTPYPLPQPREPVASSLRTVAELVAWEENYPRETEYFLRLIEQDFIHKAKTLGMGQTDLDQLVSLRALRAAQESAKRLEDFSTLVKVCVLQAFSEYAAKSATPELNQLAKTLGC